MPELYLVSMSVMLLFSVTAQWCPLDKSTTGAWIIAGPFPSGDVLEDWAHLHSVGDTIFGRFRFSILHRAAVLCCLVQARAKPTTPHVVILDPFNALATSIGSRLCHPLRR